ncbi:MAG: AsmA family protein [Candidatus Thiodiazotropha sp. (ex Dulcina madagascariensis)]|nr:AsmA family protein [Candidatus Thiodiazotropha sp. (ex Dulcina madagascariensis)]MCU7925000.1 AsmA family protein [Candidatus Thiodiazotropha sp. (ex Dulcina madagascariensis)]
MMGKTFKVLGWLVGMLIVLLIAAIILIPLFVDPNDHKERIVAEVKKATGRDLGITGDIGLSIFPRLALELNGLTLSNAPGFDSGDFASVKHAEVRVNLMPLLFKQLLEVDTVQIEGVALNLAKSKSGVTNWEDMTGRKPADESPDVPPELPGEGMGLLAFTIGGLSIKEASLVWDDQVTGERYEVEGIHLETGELAPGKEVELSFGLALSSRKPALKGTVELTSQLLVLPKQERLSLDGLNLQVKASGEGLPENGIEALLQTDLRLNLEKNTLDLQDFSLASGAINLTGRMEGEDIQTTPAFKGEFKLAKFSPREWLTRFGIPLPETADPEVLQALSLSSGFTASSGHVVLEALIVTLDQTLVRGDMEILDFTKPTYLFNLDVDSINLDRYLPPTAEQARPARRPEKPGSSQEPLFPTEALSQLKLDGTLRVGNLTVNNLHAEAIQIKVRGREGKINLDHDIGRFYDGLLKGSVQLDVSGERPRLKMSQQASRILASPLLLDLTGEDKLSGSGDLDLQLTSQGDSVKQMKRTLNGQLSFDFRDGAVKGFNLAKMIRDTKARLKGESLMVLNEPEQTDFSELSGRAVIENGVVNNQALLAKSPYLRLEGSGKAYLLEERLNYSIRPVIVNTPSGQGGEALEELVGIPIPVKIKGPWSDPAFSIQLSKILEEQQKARLKEKFDDKVDEKIGEKLDEKIPDELQDKLKDKLKRLF